MTAADRISFVLRFIIEAHLDAILRPLWLIDLRLFEATLGAMDCHPFRVCYEIDRETGRGRQLWLEEPGQLDSSADECWEEEA